MRRGGLRPRLVHVGEDRQSVLAGKGGDAFEQFRRAALRRRRCQRPCRERPRLHAESRDLARNEIQFFLRRTARSDQALANGFGQLLRHQWCDVERRAVTRGDRKDDADSGLRVGRQHGVDDGLIRRVDGQEVLYRGDAVAQHLDGTDQRADAQLVE